MRIAKPYLIWGPYVAPMPDRQSSEEDGYSLDSNSSVDRVDKFDTGFIVGFGLSLTKSPIFTSIELRYAQGLFELYDGPQDCHYKNSVLSISLAYGITKI